MALRGKRMSYEKDAPSTSEEETDYNSGDEVRSDNKNNVRYCSFDFQNEMPRKLSQNRPKRKPSSFSKNALMARENRLRKKIYVSNLERTVANLRKDNKKLSLITDNQSSLILNLQKEVKYLKSVIANSNDISTLIQNIHQSSGMSVSSSLDENLSLKNSYIPKPQHHDFQKLEQWKHLDTLDTLQNDSLESPSNVISDDFYEELFKNDFDLNLPKEEMLNDFLLEPEVKMTNNDHNYTLTNGTHNQDDVGVCLHVSKHHVSLEFCSTCSEKALQTWVG